MTFRFLGTSAEFHGLKPERFGEVVELPQADGEAVTLTGAAILPDAEFAALGFTDAELAAYPAVGAHSLAPADFIRKRDAAWAALREYRTKLAATAAEE